MTNGLNNSNNGQFQTGNSGRPKGSKNRAPNIDELNILLDMITSDLIDNYTKLTTNQKIRILHSFARKYEGENIVALENVRFEFGT